MNNQWLLDVISFVVNHKKNRRVDVPKWFRTGFVYMQWPLKMWKLRRYKAAIAQCMMATKPISLIGRKDLHWAASLIDDKYWRFNRSMCTRHILKYTFDSPIICKTFLDGFYLFCWHFHFWTYVSKFYMKNESNMRINLPQQSLGRVSNSFK